MKQHTDICAQVQRDAKVNPWLKALNVALNTPTLCGSEPCWDKLQNFVSRCGWTAVGCCLLVALFSPQVLLPSVRRTRHWALQHPTPPADGYCKPVYITAGSEWRNI
eukprot:32526-Rhodomonas_salina.2